MRFHGLQHALETSASSPPRSAAPPLLGDVFYRYQISSIYAALIFSWRSSK
ncbi:MAG: hypothetical protein ACRC2R_17495 [Xenococcaceae cyanobacterium]